MIGFIQILGGLALLLYGIRLLSSGMEKLTGDQIQRWLDRVTSNRFKSAGFGAFATAMIQSSGLLMVTMIGLINANLMSVKQAIGVMLGQEIGTTFTAQIVAFDIGKINLLFIVLGVCHPGIRSRTGTGKNTGRSSWASVSYSRPWVSCPPL